MSWQAYVDDQLLGTGKVHKAAILGQQGGVWAISSGFNLTPQEQTAILNAVKAPKSAEGTGVHLAGQKFFTILTTDRSIYGKKGVDGCVLVRTNQAVLVAEYNPPAQQTEAVTVVEGLADYLIKSGY